MEPYLWRLMGSFWGYWVTVRVRESPHPLVELDAPMCLTGQSLNLSLNGLTWGSSPKTKDFWDSEDKHRLLALPQDEVVVVIETAVQHQLSWLVSVNAVWCKAKGAHVPSIDEHSAGGVACLPWDEQALAGALMENDVDVFALRT